VLVWTVSVALSCLPLPWQGSSSDSCCICSGCIRALRLVPSAKASHLIAISVKECGVFARSNRALDTELRLNISEEVLGPCRWRVSIFR
jgi:hypothetical protein